MSNHAILAVIYSTHPISTTSRERWPPSFQLRWSMFGMSGGPPHWPWMRQCGPEAGFRPKFWEWRHGLCWAGPWWPMGCRNSRPEANRPLPTNPGQVVESTFDSF